MIFARPSISSKIMTGLFNEGFVTPKRVDLKKIEIVSGAGATFSIFFIGAFLFFVGLIMIFATP